MRSEIEELLDDILREAGTIREFVSGFSFETYVQDKKTRFAVERCFEIIGEALSRIAKVDPEVMKSIRNHRSIISFRNILAHAYDHIEDEIVWGIIENDLDAVIEDVSGLRNVNG